MSHILLSLAVSIDTFSGALFASCHIRESAKNVCCHFTSASAVIGIPLEIKIAKFFALWEVTLKLGFLIPPWVNP